jgi:hypothetical protein
VFWGEQLGCYPFIRSGEELDLEKIANIQFFLRQSLDFHEFNHTYTK